MANSNSNLQSYLDDMGVCYRLSHHPTAYTAQMLAEAEHVPGRKVIKPVVVRADGEFVMCVLPACYRVDLGELKDQLQVNEVRLADEQALAGLFPGCDVGANGLVSSGGSGPWKTVVTVPTGPGGITRN